MALGSDMGFGGYVGVLALPGALVLLASARRRRRWTAPLLCLGALLAVATSLQRTAVLGAVAALLALVVLSFSLGRRVTRPLAALLIVIGLAFALGSVLASSTSSGVFSRYSSITPNKAASTSVGYREKDLTQIPTDIAHYPFGAGLSSVGAGASFGGNSHPSAEGLSLSAESQYNYVTLELGLPGLLLWIALSLKLIVLVVRRLRGIQDIELRMSLAGVFATVIAFTIMGLAGPTMSSLPYGPYFWFALGIAAYWFAGPARSTDALVATNSA
jgi:O-antigen ligase